MIQSLEGIWDAKLKDGSRHSIRLPGTLDESRIGFRDYSRGDCHPEESLGTVEEYLGTTAPIATRFTRKYTYEGEAIFTKKVTWKKPEGERIFLEVERARCLRLFVDGQEMKEMEEASISTPRNFELTAFPDGTHELELRSDNHYPGLPHDAILYSSAATDETQTNWNGILGRFCLRTEKSCFVSGIRVYPKKETLTVQVDISAANSWEGTLELACEALQEPVRKQITVSAGTTQLEFSDLLIQKNARRWDENEGNLYELTVSAEGMEEKTAVFGIRDFGDNGKGRLAWNGRTIFLRSEANCAEFPETGYPPMEVDTWLEILKRYRSYGINCMRFHSHCPPEAAFTAADQLGMLMQPELSHWNPKTAFESDESFSYYQKELHQVIRFLANHPSFVMLTFGNELSCEELGTERMKLLVRSARAQDSTRLYANASNPWYGARGCDPESDFYTSSAYNDKDLRAAFADMKGYLNHQYPNAKTDYEEAMKELRRDYSKPVFSFEVGQFEILPDFDELDAFHGISEPVNFLLIQKKVEERGLTGVWKQYVEATGELSRIGYREEIEAAMRTDSLSGISLLSLQDFPGQGTALVGMMNSHLQPKPYAFSNPDEFRTFFRDQLPLVYLSKYTYESTEILTAEVWVANYGRTEVKGTLQYCLRSERTDSRWKREGSLAEATCPIGMRTLAGTIEIPLGEIQQASRLNLTVSIDEITNTYPVWVYPPVSPVCPESVYETKALDEKAEAVLEQGGIVYLSPDSVKEALPHSIQAQFTTDFWSVGTFPTQEGGMGQLIDSTHPLFQNFPTEPHTNWQWWPMAGQRAAILPEKLQSAACIITEMDSYAFLRPMTQLLECRCGKGRLLFSTMGLQNLQQYPEARALLSSIYSYLGSDQFAPEQELHASDFQELVQTVK